MLVILDGWGKGQKPSADAIAQADTPVVDALLKSCPNSELVTFGEEVGLPEGQMGNSEVGHLNIGAGRVVYQELARINKSVRDGELQQHPVLLNAFQYAKANNKAVHFIGLLSDGGVHSHTSHLQALCDATQKQGLSRVFVHAFMDGRDTDPKSGLGYLEKLLQNIDSQSIKLASVIGRYYAMDRDKRWERIKLAYNLLVKGIGEKTTNPLATIAKRYEADETDEFLKPIVCVGENRQPVATIQEDDVAVCFNFRTDRPREITTVLTQADMPEFGMEKRNLYYVTMTRYDEKFQNVQVVFEKDNLNNTLGEVLSDAGLTQVRIAETEKYPHVTFFFSGGREATFEGERRLMIPSPKVATYDLQPEMSAIGITDAIIKDIEINQPNFICLNYANADMVGHTGDFKAAMQAAETVDACLGRLLACGKEHGYDAIVIADHGNSDYMINEDGTPNTAHTMNPVPCVYVGSAGLKIANGNLADIAPTILGLLGISLPKEMDGKNLLSK
ncbi:MAG: 2,3-bisphosphoglycerate-independent phosphoglycerate mutase [Saprospiraceae bacterium]|nr:2,3-bisphosphoglycerate-independent phosphoglycerate mutase [Saprospiraceae bacterium]MCF8251314.1 2,3-bisphosphoglycerate-independent phosphoglycerate mutase [Saprospiraceae bacterium]MCF8280615.1 2,3-bisphosphoglycerate-independent phosphoglycerate mutase [Bacteroidales bacterium]MCF8313189.1 2,3-bisphosphoglycerate-independent phosphoglycerate mutase [Saprospiraceae bacterium]MCF8441647.1 2,3-bisphosphoglycerate-independent phosphoglycerate mutase [Saprospiraceae bacterium]